MRKLLALLIIFSFCLLSCSEKKQPLTVGSHPSDWLEVHGKMVVKDSSLSMQSCQACHGVDYSGGASGVSCYSCHVLYPHTKDWLTVGSATFHGGIALQSHNDKCQSCHGEDYKGGNSEVSCYDCHAYPHALGWQDENSVEFHGKVSRELGKEECQACHGTDFSGGSSGKSCFECHTYPHKDGFAQPGSPNFHRGFIKQSIKWDLSQCQACHGSDYTGGRVEVSCTTCHTSVGGPEACNTCHGNENNFAPPVDLSGNTDISATGVGAHQKHVADTKITVLLDCEVCHTPVVNFSDATHIDDPPSPDIHFNTLATDSNRLTTVWTHGNATCSEAYCHGAFEFKKSESAYAWAYTDSVITGNQNPVVWTQTAVEDSCKFCHDLPPEGHVAATINTCTICHGSVVDANGVIIDKTKHIDGKIDVF